MSNPYQPPLTTDTPALSQRLNPIPWIAFLTICAVVAMLTYGAPFITVIAIAIVGAIVVPFIRPAFRRKLVWGFIFGLVLAVILPIGVLLFTMEPPNTYAASDAFSDRLNLILAFTIPLGVWVGSFASAWSPNVIAEQ
jgi:hypothetical protein